jgi:phage tail sheath protein FI
MVETRKDAVALISPPTSTVLGSNPLSAVVSYFDSTMTQKSNYAFVDSNVKYQYDKYNDKYRWLPLNGDIAGLMARTDNDRDPWFSPAGFNRGVIKNSVKLGWDQTKVHRDTIYPKAINPVVTFPGQGTVLYGDRTHTTKPSAFDRINVRRLFIILEKSIATAAKFTLFEFNDAFTRSQFTALVEPFLREVKGRRGIYDFLVVCDETNNTPAVVDANEFVGDIFIKPARSINYIQLNFIATRTGTEFEEIVGSA